MSIFECFSAVPLQTLAKRDYWILQLHKNRHKNMDIFIYRTFVSTISDIKKTSKNNKWISSQCITSTFLGDSKKKSFVSNFWEPFNHNSKAGNISASIASQKPQRSIGRLKNIPRNNADDRLVAGNGNTFKTLFCSKWKK